MKPSSAYIANARRRDHRAQQLARLALGAELLAGIRVARRRRGPARRRGAAAAGGRDRGPKANAASAGRPAPAIATAALTLRRPGEEDRPARRRAESRRSRAPSASCRPPSLVGTAAHIPRSSWRRNSSIRRSSSSATSGSPSASSTSPCPGFMRTSFMDAIMPAAAERGRRAARRSASASTGPGPAPISRRPCRPPRRRSARASSGGLRELGRARAAPPAPSSGCSRSRARPRRG